MSAAAAKKAKRKGLLVLLVIVVATIVLVIPPALAGGLMVPVSKVVFGETTGSLSAAQTIDLGNTNISGGIGTRTHTIYLSIDQGVRISGAYTLSIDITANVTVGGLLQLNLTHVVTTTFTVS